MRRARKAKKTKTTDESERLKLCANDRDRFLVLAGSFDSPSRGLGSNGAGERELFSHLCFAVFFLHCTSEKKKKSFNSSSFGATLETKHKVKKEKAQRRLLSCSLLFPLRPLAQSQNKSD